MYNFWYVICKKSYGNKGYDFFFRDFGDVESNLIGFCNVVCYCLFIFYELVCGMDGLVYFFFCYVGCRFNYKWMDGFMGKFKVYISIVCVYI